MFSLIYEAYLQSKYDAEFDPMSGTAWNRDYVDSKAVAEQALRARLQLMGKVATFSFWESVVLFATVIFLVL